MNKEELLLKVEAPEILCKWGLKHEAKEMIKAHNAIIERKAGAIARPDGMRTVKQAETIRQNQQKQRFSAFRNSEEYRKTARAFLEKVLPMLKRESVNYEKAIHDATEKYNAVSAELEKCKHELAKCRQNKKDFDRTVDKAVIQPFIYANDILQSQSSAIGSTEPLYPQLKFLCGGHNVAPAEHIQYMLSFIDSLDKEGK